MKAWLIYKQCGFTDDYIIKLPEELDDEEINLCVIEQFRRKK